MEIPLPPNDIELRNIIDKLADFVARNGPEFESMTKSKQKGNPKFAFLYGGEFYNYYQYKVITRQALLKQQSQPNMSLPPLMGQQGFPQMMQGFGQQPGLSAMQQQQQQQQMHHQQQSQSQLPPTTNANSGGSNAMPQIWSNPPPVNTGPSAASIPIVQNNLNAQLTAQLETLTKQQHALSEQIRQSEMNLTAQHEVLLQQQQVQIDEALNRAQEDMLLTLAKENNISLLEFDSKLQPIIESCTKDSISNGKGWILQHCTDSGKCQIISQYLLRKVLIAGVIFTQKLHLIYLVNDVIHHCIRKNAEELKKCLESAVIPMFCNAQITANDEQRMKLSKLLSLWESKGNFFDACVISKLKSPPSSLQEYQTSLLSQHANVVAAVRQTTKTTFDNYQQQHQAFVQHATQQIALLEKQKQQQLEQHARKTGGHGGGGGGIPQAPPPPLLPELMAAVVGASGVAANGSGIVVGVPGAPPGAVAPSAHPQLPVGDQRGGNGAQGGGGGPIPSLLDQNINFGLLSAAIQKLKNLHDNGQPSGGPGTVGPQSGNSSATGSGRPEAQDGAGGFTQPPPNFPIPDLSRPPPNFQYNAGNQQPPTSSSGGEPLGNNDHPQQQQQPHLHHAGDGRNDGILQAPLHDERDRELSDQPLGGELDGRCEQQDGSDGGVQPAPAAAAPPVKIPYFELPAGLMVPLIRLEDFSYHSLDPDEIRLPPPTPTNDRLVSAVEAFFAPPSHERPRDGEGWEKLALYEYFKVKNASRKQKEDEIDRGLRDRSRSPSPIDPDLLKVTKKHKKRVYRSKSRSRSRSPADNGHATVAPAGGQQVNASIGGGGGSGGSGNGGNGRNQRRDHRNHRSRSKSRSRSRSPRSPAGSLGSQSSASGRRVHSRSPPSRRGGGGGGGDRDRDRVRESRRSPTPPSFATGGFMKTGSNFAADDGGPAKAGPGHHPHHLMKGGGGGGNMGAVGSNNAGTGGGDRIGLGATIEPLRHESNNPADPYESFRRNKGAAFITRMKARADERN
ncbi:calcium homeostasis endoplasmic reticulum protein-like [Anopheles albimanus]|uniref:SURP motif domain-containing protein n=1 Tax=Anopheles albimanus TaxID=7167 RepID=A0A182FH02_ANOAL|nr:calcium homeostasis endoplasmic reticulum protein-like [Anopheles albimanus]